jgi:hypothetical protein
MKAVSSILVLVGVLTACSDQPESREPEQVSAQELDEEAGKPSVLKTPYDRQQREEYEARVEAILSQYAERWEKLKATADRGGPETSAAIRPVLTRLDSHTAAVAKILGKLKAADFDSWQDLKVDVHAALDDLEISYNITVADLQDLTGQRYVPDRATAKAAEPSQEVVANEVRHLDGSQR